MSTSSWEEVIGVTVVDGTAVTAAAEAIIVPDFTIPASYMQQGRIIRARLWGKSSTVITTPGTLQVRVRWGGVAGVLLADSGALTQRTASAATNETWSLEFDIICRSAGATGTFVSFGKMSRGNKANAATTDATPDLLPVSGAAAVTVDTTTAKALSVTFTPSVGTGSHTCMGYQLESLN